MCVKVRRGRGELDGDPFRHSQEIGLKAELAVPRGIPRGLIGVLLQITSHVLSNVHSDAASSP